MTRVNRVLCKAFLALALAWPAAGATAPGPTAPPETQALGRAILKELVEINSTHAFGSTAAAKTKERPAGSRSEPPDRVGKPRRKRRFPYRKITDIEADIAADETRLRELERLLASPDLYRDGAKVKETMRGFEETKSRLQQLYEHWEEAVELN